jgi:hypothetical protein
MFGLAMAGILGGFSAHADSDSGKPPRFSTSSGGDFTLNSRSGYAGGVWAPGGDLDADGFRVKALGGYGAYAYDSTLDLAGGAVPWRFVGRYVFGDLMGGWQKRRGEWTAKVYVGVQYIEHSISPDDPDNDVKGTRWGARGQLELWRNLGTRHWFSFDASYATAFGDYWTLARAGRRMSRRWSLGIEGGGLGNEDYNAGRGGAFLRYHKGNMEITLSGGATGDYRGEETSGYLTLGVYQRY